MLCSYAVLIHDLCINVVKYLITKCNCDPMATEHDGSTVLHHAVEQINVVKYLIIVYVHNHAYSVHPIFVMILALL